MTLSQDSIDTIRMCFNTIQLNVSAPDFDDFALKIIQAKKELTEIESGLKATKEDDATPSV